MRLQGPLAQSEERYPDMVGLSQVRSLQLAQAIASHMLKLMAESSGQDSPNINPDVQKPRRGKRAEDGRSRFGLA